MITLFSNSRELENQTDEFCDKLSEGVLAFQIGINAYFSGDTEAFAEKMGHVSEVESRGDELRREIQRRLYAETLLPESRGDVLHLLEDSDQILNACESSMWQFFIEKPEFDAQIGKEFCKLVDAVVSSAESLVLALRAFFHGRPTDDHMYKVVFYETEADKISRRVMTAVFESGADLSHKNQFRHFVLHTDNIADIAEDVADRLAIFELKRAI